MFLKKIIKRLIDINSEIIVKFLTNFKVGRYFLFKFMKKTSLDYTNECAFKNCYNHIWIKD